MKKPIGRLHIITGGDTTPASHTRIAELAVAGGADVIQYRDKHAGAAEMVDTACALRRMCSDATLIVNDRGDVALAAQSDGVHLGQDDVPVAAARSFLGDEVIIGASASTLDETLRAQDDGADYIGFGHIFETTSKRKSGSPRGCDRLAAVCARLSIPVIAIGGITKSNVRDVMEAGAHGIAVISAVGHAADPRAATRELCTILDGFAR